MKLWKTLNSLGLPSKKNSSSTICLKKNGEIQFDPKVNAEVFKDFYSNLASDLVKALPQSSSRFGNNYVQNFYQNSQIEGGSFKFSTVSEEVTLKILEKFDTSKAAGIEGLSGIFIKDGANLLVKPTCQSLHHFGNGTRLMQSK